MSRVGVATDKLREAGGGPPGSVLFLRSSRREALVVHDRLAGYGRHVVVAADAAEALELLEARAVDVCVIDLADDRSVLTTVRLLRASQPSLPIVGIVDPASPASAAEALGAGLRDLLPWPFSNEDLLTSIVNAHDRATAPMPTAPGRAPVADSAAMRAVMTQVSRVADERHGVAFVSESGTDCDEVAASLHGATPGRRGAFLTVDCAQGDKEALSRQLLGSRANKDAPGDEMVLGTDSALVRAMSGTLYLANLDQMPAHLQGVLANALRVGEVTVGAELVELDVRLVVSVVGELDAAVRAGRLRPELADRCPVAIDVPPLRRRREDVPVIASRLLEATARRLGSPARSFSRSTLSLVASLPWPGNHDELTRVVEAVVSRVNGPIVQIEDLLAHVRLDVAAAAPDSSLTLREARLRFERECIAAVLTRHNGRMGEAARSLGIQRTNLYRKVRQLRLSPSQFARKR